MRIIKKNGKATVKLDKRDVRYGNFVVTTESEHYKIQTITQGWALRVSQDSVMGQLIKEGLADGDERFGRVIAYFYAVSSSVVDTDTVATVMAAYKASFARMRIKEGKPTLLYGSGSDLVTTVLNALQALNVVVSEKECKAVVKMLERNYERNKDVYFPPTPDSVNDVRKTVEAIEGLSKEDE